MELWQVVGMDPAGAEAMALCVAAALVLAVLVLGGFLMIGRANRRRAQARNPSSGSEALGVVALWRLNRSMRRVSPAPRAKSSFADTPGAAVHTQSLGGSTTTS